MKARAGFVSNSSSSSFIVGVMRFPTENTEKVEEKLKSFIDKFNFEIFKSEEVRNINDERWSPLRLRNGELTSTDKCLGVEFIDSPDKSYAHVSVWNNEGDYCFSDDEDGWDINYDKANDPEFFEKSQQELISFLGCKNDLIEQCDFTYGAERNG